MPARPLELVLFHRCAAEAQRGLDAGLRSFIVDLERRGKPERQSGADTDIGTGEVADLHVVRALGATERWCRLDPLGPWTAGQLDATLEAGATTVWLPMAPSATEARLFLRLLDGRARSGILVETLGAVADAEAIASLAPDHVFVGLQDLSIQRRKPLFSPLFDGTADRLAEAFSSTSFGLGGVTVVDGGSPLPFPLLLGEMARLGCAFSFLRRSFRREAAGRDWKHEVARIQELWGDLCARSPASVRRDRSRLVQRLAARRA